MDKPSNLDAADTLVASEASQRKRAGLLVEDVMRVRLVESTEAGQRYLTEGELGKGGMGVVSLVRDRRIGRRVATKRLRAELASDAATRARFLREAQVQGQLEHPAVVPVYDLGVDEDGTSYFTMQSVRGLTLHEIIEGLRNGDVELARKHTRHRLLTAFASVCLAIDYAHQRGIIHRDLKPANLMLGDFGETYVLDWGLAKIQDVSDDALLPALTGPGSGGLTEVGTLLGTPGYMAPEQLDRASAVGPAADVYALGAILFELLALEPLHARKNPLVTYHEGVDARPSVRAPHHDPPPELDAVCTKATARDPDQRYASARELHDAVQRFLEGERDLELRREKARDHAVAAKAASENAARNGSLDARRDAMREIGRSLALDPGNPEAVSTMVSLMSTPPDDDPPEVTMELARAHNRNSRWISTVGMFVYPAMLGFLPVLLWMGIREPLVVATFFGLMLACCGLSAIVARSKVPPDPLILLALVLSSAAFAVASRFGSPILITPVALAVNASGYAIFVDRRLRIIVAAVACIAFAAPLALELAGVLSPTIFFEGGKVMIEPRALSLPAVPTLVMVTVAVVSAIVLSTVVVGHIRDRLREAERRLMLYTWHLREVVPAEARGATDRSVGRY